jgi:hypothetical protein
MSRFSKSVPATGGVVSQPEMCPSHRGTSWTVTPLGARAFQGRTLEGNSPAGRTISSPAFQFMPRATAWSPAEVPGTREMSAGSPWITRAAASRAAWGTPRKSSSQRRSQGECSRWSTSWMALETERGTGPSAQCMSQT